MSSIIDANLTRRRQPLLPLRHLANAQADRLPAIPPTRCPYRLEIDTIELRYPRNPAIFQTKPLAAATKAEFYADLAAQLRGLLGDETDAVANAANTAALIFTSLHDLNWAGFYFRRGDELIVGPFQGKLACVRIALGRGVCGTAAASRQTIVVDDVHAFRGHIACDAASRSEIVVPLLRGEQLLGVFDLDSPMLARFTVEDRHGIEQLAAIYCERSA